jgi:quinohemoprotein ethanol dehydrogenase
LKFFVVLIAALLPFLSLELQAAAVSDQRLQQADQDVDNWLTHGGTYRELRFSPLSKINAGNIDLLGLAWSFETDTARGLQATPLVIDGVMYITGAWSVVYALDAVTGSLLWKYDPQVPRESAYKYCCGVVNRGVAAWGDSIFVGSLDGRLISLDAVSGALNWQQQTVDSTKPYSITGAPRVVNGKVIIGNGGAEYGVRGYVSAYDAASGEQLWRFYTVPGNPAKGFENPQMAMASATWSGEWWRLGGGGTVWDSIAFDPELNLLYIGVGNGSPHNQQFRSPDGGDNLFLTSIVALDPDTGEYVWHYQQVNGESWDYTATQQMVLLDIEWQGQPRKVIMQAPKAGFFYIIDRVDGELLSAEPYVRLNWASHVDLETGRPVENPAARYPDGSTAMVYPTGMGGHNWHSMSFNPQTGLMYIPVQQLGFQLTALDKLEYQERQWHLGYDSGAPPGNHLLTQALLKEVPRGYLLAWDPMKQTEAWRGPYPYIGNGGTLSTGGNLVFQGSADGYFHAYHADTGERLWSFATHNGIMAAPVSFAIDGEQYISVLVGRGGGMSMYLGIDYESPVANPRGRVMTFKLGGTAELPPLPELTAYPEPPALTGLGKDEVEAGRIQYNQYCARCHGPNAVSDGSVPDLRRLPTAMHVNFADIVLRGLLEGGGMPRFDDVLSTGDVTGLQAYLIQRAHEDKAQRESWQWWLSFKKWVYSLYAKTLAWFLTLF